MVNLKYCIQCTEYISVYIYIQKTGIRMHMKSVYRKARIIILIIYYVEAITTYSLRVHLYNDIISQ